MVPASLLLTTSSFFIFIVCSLKNSQNFFIQSLLLYTPCLLSMYLNDDIVDIEKPDVICLLTFVVDEFWGLFSHLSIFSIKHSRSAYIINDALSNFWYWLTFDIDLNFSVFRRNYKVTKVFILTYLFMRFTFVFCGQRMKTIQTVKITVMFGRYSS